MVAPRRRRQLSELWGICSVTRGLFSMANDAARSFERTLVFAVLGAVWWWCAVRFIWPLCGPYLLEPCPLPTPTGYIVAFMAGGLWGLAKGVELEVRS